jgi:hypothetical protein
MNILALAGFGAVNYNLFLQRKSQEPVTTNASVTEQQARFAIV